MKTESELLRLAEAVADGTPVDWEREGSAHGEIGGKLRHLQLVESIGHTLRKPARLPSGDEEIPSRWGSLEVRERLGRGGFGEVYRAWDPNLQRDVALKLLRRQVGPDEAARSRFLNEARRLARVKHPNVVVVHGVDEHGGHLGLWIDLLEGRTLEALLADQGPLGAREATAIGIDLCRALAAVHAEGLVHGDVKALNVIREIGGRIVLMDFGCSSERYAAASSAKPLSGTPSYMAPELFLGAAGGPQTDIFALGVLLYRLVTGRYPTDSADPRDMLEHLVPLRDVRPDLPGAFVGIVERAIAPVPEERFTSAGEMERALTVSIGVASEAEPRAQRNSWRRPALAAAAAVAVVVALLAFTSLRESVFGRFEVDASWFRRAGGVEERLREGGSIAPGDRLFLEVDGSKPMHVYVLNQDAAGDSFVLFPLPGLDAENPLPAGERHRLPGPRDGVDNFWNVTSAGGEEVLLVVASRSPVDEMESMIEAMPRAGSGAALALEDPGVVTRLRGIGGLSAEPSAGGPDSAVSDVAGRLTVRAAESDGLWLWELRLTNPAGEGP